MGDLEVLKLIVNGGSFALLVVIVLWALFRLSPQLTTAVEKMSQTHAEAYVTSSADHKSTMEAIAAAHKEAVAAILREFREMVTAHHKECREERMEILARVDEQILLLRDAVADFHALLKAGKL